MCNGVAVRPATLEDLPGVNRVAAITWPATYIGAIPDNDIQAFLQSNYNPDQLERSLARLGSGFLVAVDGQEVAGYAMVSRDGDGHAQLWTIYVLPERQGQGIGKQLWEAVLAHASSIPLQTLVLWVLESNSTARRFYERQGARRVGQRDVPVGGEVVSEVRYQLDLT